jgi:putative flippase GtrA
MSETGHITVRSRARMAIRHPPHYFQLLRFLVVGSTGFAVNIATFTLLVHGLDVHYRVAGAIGVIAGILDTYVFNRLWTFGRGDKPPHIEASSYFLVYLCSLAASLITLTILVENGVPKVIGQATGSLVGLPINFLGLRQWVFRRATDRVGGPPPPRTPES